MMIVLNTLPDVPHHYVDKGVFYEGEEDEECAGGHEHVNRLKTKDMNMIVKQDIEKINERKVCREIRLRLVLTLLPKSPNAEEVSLTSKIFCIFTFM